MRNTIFQWIFYRLVRPLCGTKGDSKIGAQSSRIMAQIRLARLFGGAKRVLIGDSNSAVFCNLAAMRQFRDVTLALGVGGTTANDWLTYFGTAAGKRVLSYIRQCDIIWNIGGNYVLLDQMDLADAGLAKLRAEFPRSWNCLTPPVRAGILEEVGRAIGKPKIASEFQADFARINAMIVRYWQVQAIDLFTVFCDPKNQEAYFFALRDMVHYSTYAIKIIRNVVEAIS